MNTDDDEKMIIWVSNELYEHLLKKPEWMIKNFGFLKDGDKIPNDTCDVMRREVGKFISDTPDRCMSLNHFSYWTLKPYVPIFKGAYKEAQTLMTKAKQWSEN